MPSDINYKIFNYTDEIIGEKALISANYNSRYMTMTSASDSSIEICLSRQVALTKRSPPRTTLLFSGVRFSSQKQALQCHDYEWWSLLRSCWAEATAGYLILQRAASLQVSFGTSTKDFHKHNSKQYPTKPWKASKVLLWKSFKFDQHIEALEILSPLSQLRIASAFTEAQFSVKKVCRQMQEKFTKIPAGHPWWSRR